MATRKLRITLGLLSLTASASAAVLMLPEQTIGLTPLTKPLQQNQTRVVLIGQSTSTTQKSYTNKQFGFRFSYPTQLALDKTREKKQPRAGETLRSSLSLWPQKVYDSIQAGKYEGGTEYPPSIDVSVHNNPKKLSLVNWAKGHQPGIQNVRSLKVDGQAGIAYTADGLYASDNVAFYSPNRQIILLSVGYLNPKEQPLRSAFRDIVASFQFVR
ncbi:MAG: hypothetical protein KME43_06065 [Myxacorys chilensis ATA2-1-KO14]|jgi:hypothetical protein|nr:hypothetical protein [Myxacorys chilensis ATA2-1-KO14]